ncbi:MAG: hypothetical protein [Caudoviricetes sp.]|nr:MAG: hypothetical protein [Caudoviricetes sp.]
MKITGLNTCLKALQFDDSGLYNILNEAGSNILASTESIVSQVDPYVAASYNMFVTKQGDKIIVNVGSDLDLSAYVEFGTGSYVIAPNSEVNSDYMMQFFKNGKGTIRPHSGLVPSFRIERQRVIQAIQDELKRQF